jgi:cobalt-precorrin-5B (C1)-methyltransferase
VTAELRTGFTTGACAAAAAKAAALVLGGARDVTAVGIPFPDGTRVDLPVAFARISEGGAEAAVKKYAGDDPDVTDGALVVASVARDPSDDLVFAAGEGIGTVTKPGLQVPPGEPAINPGPRGMIRAAVREATPAGLRITLSIPGGRDLAAKTFNPRLGVQGGLSILGTTGRVRPFSVPALREALSCALDVALACGVRAPVLVPGHIGERAARRHFVLTDEQVIHVGNEWGFMLSRAAGRNLDRLLLVGHPGKLAKLADGEWDTHSNRSPAALDTVCRLASDLGITLEPGTPTVEGVLEALGKEARQQLGSAVARAVRGAVQARVPQSAAVVLVNMKGDWLGSDGDVSPWR